MTTAETFIVKSFKWVFLAAILLLIAFVWLWMSKEGNESTYRRDREAAQQANTQLRSELKSLDGQILTERRARQFSDSLYRLEHSARIRDLNALKRRERKLRPDTIIKTLVDTIYQKYDSALIAANAKNKSDSTSFTNDLTIAGRQIVKLDSAYTSVFQHNQNNLVDLEKKDKKIKWLQKLSTALGISTGTLAAILIAISVF